MLAFIQLEFFAWINFPSHNTFISNILLSSDRDEASQKFFSRKALVIWSWIKLSELPHDSIEKRVLFFAKDGIFAILYVASERIIKVEIILNPLSNLNCIFKKFLMFQK